MAVQHHVIRLKPGNLLKESLEAFAKTNNVQAGWIVTAVGSLTEYNLRYANQDETSSGSGHFEIVSLTGTLAISGVHLHMSIADSLGVVTGGHLMPGNRVYTTVEIVIAADNEKEFIREIDSTYGYRELKVR